MKITAQPLSVPTVDPFVISSGQVQATRSVLVEVQLENVTGLGEAACLPPVTHEDQPDVLAALSNIACIGDSIDEPVFVEALDLLREFPVARAGLEMAYLDAKARVEGKPLWRYLGGTVPTSLVSDVTLPILAPERMAELAEAWWQRGFRKFKIKAGINFEQDVERLRAVHRAVPKATFQPDANGGFTVEQALKYLALPFPFTCFEQPCATSAELRELQKNTSVPIIADESVKQVSDLDRIEGVRGVNLKIAKSGGILAARAIGEEAQRRGMLLMVGGMVETRLGMTAAAHLAMSLGGAEFVDLDTAFLLTEDPFAGGYQEDQAELKLPDTPGLGIVKNQQYAWAPQRS